MSDMRKRQKLMGEIVSEKMDKTVVVKVTKKVPHPVYGKYVKRSKKYLAHIGAVDAKEGNIVEKILNKIKTGINFFQTQYVFDKKILKEYMKVLDDVGILEKTFFIIGLGPFTSAKSAIWMNKNLFGVNVPEKIIKRLEQSKDEKEESKKICLELIKFFVILKGLKGFT